MIIMIDNNCFPFINIKKLSGAHLKQRERDVVTMKLAIQ